MTTVVTLTTVVLNDAQDPTDELVLTRLNSGGYTRTLTRPGRIQPVAGGFRVITTGTQSATWALEATRCTLDVVEWLEDHIGRTVTVRDDAGRKYHAVYFAIDATEVPRPRTTDVTLELIETTWTEAV